MLRLEIDEARQRFAELPKLRKPLDALSSLGLGYLTLGQPATTLSGGEAQRLRLAKEFARVRGEGCWILLDEASSGLHKDDQARLLGALDELVDAGSTVVLVDHEPTMIAAADQLVELGPSSGEAGGRVLYQGAPEGLDGVADSPTGEALRLAGACEAKPAALIDEIRLEGVRTHNLRGLDVAFRPGEICAVSGVSGSGKSSLVFETLAAEGLRRFAEALSPTMRRELRASTWAELDSAEGLRPTIALRGRPERRSPRATLGLRSGLDEILRLLFGRAAQRFCPDCGNRLEEGACGCGHRGPEQLMASHFSFNHGLGACPRCEGRGELPKLDPQRLLEEPALTIGEGAFATTKAGRFLLEIEGRWHALMLAASVEEGVDLNQPWAELEVDARCFLLQGGGDRVYSVDWEAARKKGEKAHRFEATWPGLDSLFAEEYEKKRERKLGPAFAELMGEQPCGDCRGEALGAEFRRRSSRRASHPRAACPPGG